MQQRREQGAAADGGVERLQGGPERERARDHADDVVERLVDRARRDQRERRDRQRDHERGQRRRADLARDPADGDPHRPERRRAERERDEPQRPADEVEPDQRGQDAEHHRGDHERHQRGERDLLRHEAGAADQPAHEPAERVLLALERQHPGRQQQRDEHHRRDHRDLGRERAQRRVGSGDDDPLDLHGLADRGEDRLREVEVVGREAREARDLLERHALRRVLRQARERRRR